VLHFFGEQFDARFTEFSAFSFRYFLSASES
jgi:hypothetical protein